SGLAATSPRQAAGGRANPVARPGQKRQQPCAARLRLVADRNKPPDVGSTQRRNRCPRWHHELRGRLHPMSATAIKSLYQKLRLYLFNTSRMMAERLLNIGVGFAVAVLLARYLGPERFGILSYAISVTAIFASAGHMGLAGLVVREVVREPHEVPKILGTTFMLKLTGMAIGFLLVLGYAVLFEEIGSLEFWMLLIVASAIFFQTFDVVEYWFQSQVQAKYPAIAKSSAVLLAAALKVGLILSGAGLLAFAFAHTAQFVVAALILAYLYKSTTRTSVIDWQANLAKAKQLLSQGWI